MRFTEYGDAELCEYFKSVFADEYRDAVGNEIEEIAPAWAKDSEFEQKRQEVSHFYRLLIPHLDLSKLPGVRMRFASKTRLGKLEQLQLDQFVRTMMKFDEVLGLARSTRLGKFYREHMSHMARTLLLSSFLIKEIKRLTNISLSDLDLDAVLLACLFHDICQPVQEVNDIVSGLAMDTRNVASSFKSVKIGKPKISRYPNKNASRFFRDLAEFNEEAGLTSLDSGALSDYFSKNYHTWNHGVLSSFETSLMLEESSLRSKGILKGLLAIALHDLSVDVDLERFPELYLLVLADNLQDWGRPLYKRFEPLGFIGNITDRIGIHIVNMEEPTLRFHLDYSRVYQSGETYFFDIVEALKDKNSLGRLRAGDVELEVHFQLPGGTSPRRQEAIKGALLRVSKGNKRWYPKLYDLDYEGSLEYLEKLIVEYVQQKPQLLRPRVIAAIDTVYMLSELGIEDDRVLDIAIGTIKYLFPSEEPGVEILLSQFYDWPARWIHDLARLASLGKILLDNLRTVRERRPDQVEELIGITINNLRPMRFPMLIDELKRWRYIDLEETIRRLKAAK